MSEASSPKAPHLVEAKPLTFIDHVVNIFHLVIKELRSIRADPVMLLLVVYVVQHLGEHGRHRRGDGGDQPFGRHRR